MGSVNIEIKARAENPARIRAILQGLHADYKGLDHQVDTYFNVPTGRLKLREGNIENSLIRYHRDDQPGPKRSDFLLLQTEPGSLLKTILTDALGIMKVVDKRREIYYIGNVKFHIDQVQGLGGFVEIEATDLAGTADAEKLQEQCRYYLALFAINDRDLVPGSYSEMS